MWITATLLSFLVQGTTARAASFDCGKASTKVELTICGNAEISKLDDELGKIYSGLFKKVSIPSSLSREQRTWLMVERDACRDADCLKTAYRNRIDEFKSWQVPGSFITVLDKDKPLCESYKRYVEHEVGTKKQYGHSSSPMCQRTFGEGFPEFSPVKWREIQPKDYPVLAVQARRYINNSLPWSLPWNAPETLDKDFQNEMEAIKNGRAYGLLHMWVGEADIGNTGYPEKLLRVEANGECGELTDTPPRWAVPVMVVDAKSNRMSNKTEWLLGVSVLPEKLKPIYADMHSLMLEVFDVFSFAGQTYYDRWEDEWTYNSGGLFAPESHSTRYAALTVYTVTQEKSVAVCRYKFKKNVN